MKQFNVSDEWKHIPRYVGLTAVMQHGASGVNEKTSPESVRLGYAANLTDAFLERGMIWQLE